MSRRSHPFLLSFVFGASPPLVVVSSIAFLANQNTPNNTRADALSLHSQSTDDEEDKKAKKDKEKKAKKAAKDPNAPKRPASAYLEFQNAVRNDFRAEDPGLPYAEVLRKISATWSAMGDAEKKVSLCLVSSVGGNESWRTPLRRAKLRVHSSLVAFFSQLPHSL
jgi:hypothetical protein